MWIKDIRDYILYEDNYVKLKNGQQEAMCPFVVRCNDIEFRPGSKCAISCKKNLFVIILDLM